MSASDWRNVRVKEEPMSDFEDGRGGSRSRGAGSYHEYERKGGGGERGDRRDGRRDRRERHSPSPPPTHSGGRSSKISRFSRSRSPDNRGREGDRGRSRSNYKQERSRSRERVRAVSLREDDRDRRRPTSRDRERRERERDRSDNMRRVKMEPRSPSPSRNATQDRRRREEPVQRDNQEDRGQTSREGARDGARERDWDNFFNPNSDMSKEAFVKREKGERNRKEAVEEFGKKEDDPDPEAPKEQPNFGLSGKLTEETNTFRGVVIKYSEPPEARKPNKIRWRMYPFKGEEALPVMYVHRQSAYLLGRDRKVADIPVDHPSCSKQHAVLQYRLVPYQRPDGSKGRRIKPYIIDLESANGTFVNGNKIDSKRYVELFEKDVLKFGFSSREYVLLHDESKGIEDDASEMTPD